MSIAYLEEMLALHIISKIFLLSMSRSSDKHVVVPQQPKLLIRTNIRKKKMNKWEEKVLAT